MARISHTLITLLSLAPLSTWAFDCNDILAKGVHFKSLGKLGGPHIVHWTEEDPFHEMQYNYNFTLDICNNLKKHKGEERVKDCHVGARVCAVRENIDLSNSNNVTITPIDVAGTYHTSNGRKIDARFELLRDSRSNSDAGREGLRAELHGGRFPFEDAKKGVDQRAIIEFVCDKERDGLEGDEEDDNANDPDDNADGDGDDKKTEGEERRKRVKREEGRKGKCEDSDKSLRFCGYELEKVEEKKEVQTLRLEWRTKYACEDAPVDEGAHWGFFTWFIIILFLATAAYLIFGSWLNYNRYGARGWDLLPHGDTIRDVPYILKDWGRSVMGSLSGSGGRGGYSAV